MNDGAVNKGKLARLTPGVVLDIGYMYHVARASVFHGTPNQETALQIVRRFAALSADGDVDGTMFLLGVQSVAVSYGNAVSRTSTLYMSEFEAAQQERAYEEKAFRSSRMLITNIRFWMKLLAIGALGATGYEIAQLIGYVLPEQLKTTTGKTVPALIIGALFVLVGNYFSNWWNNHRLRKINNRYSLRVLMAAQLLEERRLEHFRIHWRQASWLWKQYTGEDLPEDLPSYLFVMECEAEGQKQWLRQEHTLSKSDLSLILDSVRAAARKISKPKRERKLPPAA
jgi:hypothetical protein